MINHVTLKVICTKAILLGCIIVLHAQEVETKYGFLKGAIENEIEVFKGIPFAASPVGHLRWKAPTLPESWNGVRMADTLSPICLQTRMYPKDSPIEEMSEDCLYLNIWRPQASLQDQLPVMLWFYGGGLVNGSASIPLYDGKNLAKQEVMVITANYRLGALGFLAHPELSKEAAYNSSGNYGLLDMIAALQWIQDNIKSFGGDPDNVTVFGQSSGAISISALVASPLAGGLFHKAIAQSGGLFEPIELDDGFNLSILEQAGERFAERAGVSSIKELRKIPAEDLIKVPVHTSINIDGYVLNQSPFEAYRNNENNRVSVLLGNTKDEGQEFIADLSITRESYQKELKKHFPAWLVWMTAPNPGETDEEAIKNAVSFQGDIRFKWNMWTWAKLASNDATNKVYVYQFAKAPPFPSDSDQAGWGASHGSDLSYVFGNLDQYSWEWSQEDYQLSASMVKYWTNFAKYGDPNGKELPQWQEFSEDSPKALNLDKKITSTFLQTKGTLSSIDNIYNVARWTVRNYVLLIFLGLVVIFIVAFAVIRNFQNKRLKL
ncbi:carboxylesterase/lipase family protein [Aquiflexum lacus]|uniref:carboxylesterase/lipase family protein n=1 Tax=Aquiflexum lacus TaxID=2483805 RepID=UPI001893D646|nr:carboxylesterase family protein [Aquiflexum lacus]